MGASQINTILKARALVLLAVIFTAGGALLVLKGLGWGSGRPYEASVDNSISSSVYLYEAIGDSITYGEEFGFTVDVLQRPRKTSVVYQGWPELLGDMLTQQAGVKISAVNEGHPGDRITKVRDERIPAVFKDRPHADAALLLIGTIDSSVFHPTPSGEGCRGAACDGTLKGEFLSLISELQDHGRDTVHIALIPPVWGPDDSSLYEDPLSNAAKRNYLIMEYNRVIAHEIATQPGVKLGPDFFSCFLSSDLNRFSLFKDHLHPNALGNLMMATLWLDAITHGSANPRVDPCPSPVYILESLDPFLHGHKQNLLAEGDEYYTDESFTLTNVPDELVNGIWVLQANADKDNHDASFLNFDAGAAPVTVYIAYDPAGDPPTSATDNFAPYSSSGDLTVSDPSLGSFGIVRAINVIGMVNVGGNKSGGSPAPQQGYVVIVVP